MSTHQNQENAGRPIELAQEGNFSLGRMLVRPSRREIEIDGSADTIEPRVMQVLIALARRSGEVVSREQLTELCWAGRFVSEDAINRSMTKVRKLASPSSFTLETIPRVGYRLVPADVPQTASTQMPPSAEPATARPLDVAKTPGPRRRRWMRWAVGAGVLLLLMIIGGSIGFYLQMSRPYFAVLPFDVVGADPRASTLAAAIHGAVTTQLRTQGYKLVPQNVTADYGGERKSAAAKDFDARYFIDGSVHVERDRVRVAARIDAAGRVSVWSHEFKLDAAELASAPEHIAMTMSALFNPGVRMLFDNPPQATATIMRIGSRMRAGDDLGAYAAAREAWRQSPKTRLFANYYALSVGSALDLLPAEERLQVLHEGRSGLASIVDDPARGAPMASYVLTPPVEWSRREALLRGGLELPFSDASGLRRLLATQLANSGRLGESLAISEQAIGIDRSSSSNIVTHASVLDSIGRHQEAEAVLARAARFWSGNEFVERMRFSTALARRDGETMKALLTDPVAGPVLEPPTDARPLAAIAQAFSTRSPDDIERMEAACADPTRVPRERARFCLHALVLLDRIDTFFALAPRYFPDQRGTTSAERDALWMADARASTNARVLFRSDTPEIRADERIIPIFERLGLIDYWRETRVWPDFCNSEPESVCSRLR